MKKIVSLLLVLVLALGMSTVAFATTKPTKLTTATDFAANLVEKGTVGVIGNGTKWEFELDAGLFTAELDANGVQKPFASPSGTLTTAEIEKGKVKVTAKVSSGKAIFDSVSIDKDSGKNYVYVDMKDPILVTSDDDVDFEATITLHVGNNKYEADVFGTFSPVVLTPDGEDEGDDTSAGQLVKPTEYNKAWVAQLDADDTIEATCKLFKNRNFYIRAIQKIKDADAETADFYGFDQIYYVSYSANAVSSVQGINFLDLDKFYVYGSKSGAGISGKADIAKDLVYLGTTNDKNLPLYSKYYLSEKQIDVDSAAEIDEPADIDAPEPAPVTGGDGYIANVNDNPGTGK